MTATHKNDVDLRALDNHPEVPVSYRLVRDGLEGAEALLELHDLRGIVLEDPEAVQEAVDTGVLTEAARVGRFSVRFGEFDGEAYYRDFLAYVKPHLDYLGS